MRLLFLGDLRYNEAGINADIQSLGEYFREKGYALIPNLEGGISASGDRKIRKRGSNLAQGEEILRVLKLLSVKGVTLANNHIMDFGPGGLKRTVGVLDSEGILHCGAGMELSEALKPMEIEDGGKITAVFSFGWDAEETVYAGKHSPGCAPRDKALILKTLKEYASLHPERDIIAVLHWGFELNLYPMPFDIDLAHCIADIDSVRLVIGHHPHCPQPVEEYKGKKIYYSLGNFYFGTGRKAYSKKIYDHEPSDMSDYGIGVIYDCKKGTAEDLVIRYDSEKGESLIAEDTGLPEKLPDYRDKKAYEMILRKGRLKKTPVLYTSPLLNALKVLLFNTKRNLAVYGVLLPLKLFILSLLFLTFFSYSVSIINPYLFHYDSAYFQSVGKLWLSGIVPYRDFFDNKGPLLFLINAVAYIFPFPRFFLLLLEALFLSAALYLTFILLKDRCGTGTARASVVFFLFAYAYLINGGNSTEDHSIVFLLLVMIPEYIWITENSHGEHPVKLAFLDGIVTGLILMIVAKNVLPLAVLVMIICVMLIRDKKWENIAKNLFAGILGIAAVLLPFFLYFFSNNAAGDLFKSVFLYNIGYAASTGESLLSLSIRDLLLLLPEITALYAAVVLMVKKRYAASAGLGFTALATAFLCISGSRYKHYYILGLVLIPMVFLLWKEVRSLPLYVFLFLMVLTGIVYAPRQLGCLTPAGVKMSEEYCSDIKEIVSEVPDADKDSVFVYNMKDCLTCFYLLNDIKPLWRHSYLTEFHASFDPSVEKEAMETLSEKRPAYVLITADSCNGGLWEALEQDYSEVRRTGLRLDLSIAKDENTLVLYRRNTAP